MIAHKSSADDIMELRKVFDQYDVANNGTISYDEFMTALQQKNYPEEKVKEIFNSMVRLAVSKFSMNIIAFSSLCIQFFRM